MTGQVRRQVLWRLRQARSWLLQLHLGQGIWEQAILPCVIHLTHKMTGTLSWNHETLRAWKGQQSEEQHQDSHGLIEALVRKRCSFSGRPRIPAWASGMLCIWWGSWDEHMIRFPHFPQLNEIYVVLLRGLAMETMEYFLVIVWISSPWKTGNSIIHTMQAGQITLGVFILSESTFT